MSRTIVEFQETPNPNALKCVLDRALTGPIRSFRDAEAAKADPLAAALFGVPGVTGLLLSQGWLTVSKSPTAKWPAIKAGVQRTMASVADVNDAATPATS